MSAVQRDVVGEPVEDRSATDGVPRGDEAVPVPAPLAVPGTDDMRALGRALAADLQAGDLVLLSGDLGAGKTTLTQGIGAGLGVRGPITSPTFVIARVHPSQVGGPALVHVDAYRLAGWAELDDLDLAATLDEAVTVVEWGAGVAEGLAPDRLEVVLRRSPDESDETRWVVVRGVGRRWADVPVAATVPSPTVTP